MFRCSVIILCYVEWSSGSRSNYRKYLGEPNGIWFGVGKVEGISSLNTNWGSLPPFRPYVAHCPASLSPLGLCSSEHWGDHLLVSLFDLEDGNYRLLWTEAGHNWGTMVLFQLSIWIAAFSYPEMHSFTIVVGPPNTLHSSFEILITFTTVCLPLLDLGCPEKRACLSCSAVYPQYWAHSRCPISTCWMSEWFSQGWQETIHSHGSGSLVEGQLQRWG